MQTFFNIPSEENFQFMKRYVIKGLKQKGVYEDEWYQTDGCGIRRNGSIVDTAPIRGKCGYEYRRSGLAGCVKLA